MNISPNKLCSESGDYGCTQVTIDIPVYFNNDLSTRSSMPVNTSCVCVIFQSRRASICCDRVTYKKTRRRDLDNSYDV